MQKRSLVFLFILSISLLVTQFFFKPKVSESDKKPTELVASKTTLENRVAVQAGLPLVDLYKDESAKTFLTTGLLFDSAILTLQWDEQLPEEIYYKKSLSSFPVEKASLVQSSQSAAEPVIYQSAAHEGKLLAADLPSKGSIELQLIQPKAYKNNPTIYSSFYTQENPSAMGVMSGNAIAVASTLDGYEPVAIYIGSEGKLVPLKDFSYLSSTIQTHRAQYPNNAQNEKFYTLENQYQQLVFSNIGGAMAEINLPEQNENNTKSLVLATAQDKKLSDSTSKHAYFPAHPSSSVESKDKEGQQGGYYPLIRRSLDANISNPRYYAFNLVSNYPGLSEQVYQLKHHSKDKIVFELNQSFRKITKTFTLDPRSPYGFYVDIAVDGDRSNLWVTTGVPEIEASSNQQQPILKYRYAKNAKFDIAKQSLPKTTAENTTISPDWISNSNGFFTILVDPQTKLSPGYKVNKVTNNLGSRVDAAESKAKKTPGYEFLLPLAQDSSQTEFKVFAGPLESQVLKQAQGDNSSNYQGAQSYHGFLSFISEPCAKVLFILMNAIYKITHSWGFSIILLTVLIRVLLYPLNSWSIRAMRKTQEIAPEINAIQKKYKKNPKQGQMEIMALYRKRKVNPLTGCLPMIIQMPFLIGMFNLLRSAFVLRGVPFIKGWIPNLTAPDVLFSWSYSIPFIGTEFHLLPLLSGIMIWIQQKMSNVGPTDKSLMTDQQKQQKLMANLMVVFITFICYNMPSGLNLYWISASLLGILQQWITNRLLDKKKNKPTILVNKETALKEKQV